MKRKLYYFAMIAGVSGFAVSCGGEAPEGEGQDADTTKTEEVVEEVKFEDVCTDENDIFFQCENYDFGTEEQITFNGAFDVKRSEWVMLNDSTAELKMYNYELGAPDTATNFQIYVKFNAKNGETIQEGTYAYQDYEQNLWSKVNIITPQGTVWFNWVAGMPEQGSVKLNFFSEDQACGEFSLEVNKPENTTIGHVVLNGKWKAE